MTGGVVTLGETMGLFSAAESGSRPGSYRLGIGGAESNVAIGVARLGQHATWIGRVGNDSVGDLILRELRAEQVDTRAIVDPTARTGLMMKTQPWGDITRVEYFRADSAGSRLSADDIEPAVIAGAAVVHVSGITLALSNSARAAVERAVELATEAGIPVSFDVNHRARLWSLERARPEYLEIARRARILFAGEDEARLLVGPGTPEALLGGLAALGPEQVILKLGARGSMSLIDGEIYRMPAVAITPVDTVGAGDAFAAGYLAELAAGSAYDDRLTTATRAGAFACLASGDWEGLPRRAELELLGAPDPVIR